MSGADGKKEAGLPQSLEEARPKNFKLKRYDS